MRGAPEYGVKPESIQSHPAEKEINEKMTHIKINLLRPNALYRERCGYFLFTLIRFEMPSSINTYVQYLVSVYIINI